MTTLTSHYKQVKTNQRNSKINRPDYIAKTDVKKSDCERHLDLLKEFDMEGKYGPCIGITRLQRWERAKQYGLSPPENIKDILISNPGNNDFKYSVWHKYDI